ncbi:MAG: hypothetical protein RLZZ08_2103, partial [Pseudomonadota bacterium]
MNMRFAGALCVLASMTPVAARAQQLPAPASAEAPTSEPPAAPLPVAAQPAAIPALTPVSVEILADLGSNTSVSGARFPIRLAAPLVVDGVAVVPAGATGEGEVVHAKKSSGMGAAGELVLA